MKIKEIEECCNAIMYLRDAISCVSHDDPKFMEYASDLLTTYSDLHKFMDEEIEFIETMYICVI